jgi:hypothetical protein
MANIRERCPPEWRNEITVFDNASTWLGAGELHSTFANVYRADHNVGYWSAIDWWLDQLKENPPGYTYIIESDMIHYNAFAMPECVRFMDEHPELGGMRLHEYSVQEMYLYDKDRPIPASRRGLWQSHTNRVTGQGVKHELVKEPFWQTNFLTQLPALNRYHAMKQVFDTLRGFPRFTELDFQKQYHALYPMNALLNGGMFNCDLNPYGSETITGSWTSARELQQIGYQPTRQASITPRDQYKMTRL